MYDIIISIISFILLILCMVYIVKEVIRRNKQKIQNIYLEVNWNIGISILMWSIGAIAVVGFTVAYYAKLFNNADILGFLILCLIGLSFVFVAFVLAIKKITLNKETGDMISCSLLGVKRFHIKDITLIRHTWDAWAVFSNKRKLFVVKDRCYDYSSEFYTYIRRESGCKEIHPKGYVGRDIDS